MIMIKKELLEKKIVIILIAVLLASIFYAKNRVAKNAAGMVTSYATKFDVKLQAASAKQAARTGPVMYKGEPIRDILKKPEEVAAMEREGSSGPTSPKAKEERQSDLTLEGIIYGGPRNLAIISGNVVSEGDTVGGAKVLKIKKSSVIISRGISQIELTR